MPNHPSPGNRTRRAILAGVGCSATSLLAGCRLRYRDHLTDYNVVGPSDPNFMGDDDLTRIKGKHRSDLALEAPLSRGDQRSDTGPAELVDWAWGESPAQATAVEEDEYTFYVRIKVYNAKEWGEFAIIIFFYDYEMTVVTKQRIDLGTLAHGDSARVERELNVENGDDIKFFEIIVERTVSPHRSPSS